MVKKEVTKNYMIWTLVLAILFSLIFVCGIVLLILSLGSPVIIGLLIGGILMIIIGGFMAVLMWLAYTTACKTYSRKTNPDNFHTPD